MSEPEKTPDLPDFGLSALREGAISLHEMFKSYVEGGFTENQALRLIAEIMATHWSRNGGKA